VASKRVCARPGCPTLVKQGAYRGLCDDCKRAWNEARGTREERGYGKDHIAKRASIQRDIDAGKHIICARCPEPILAGQPWHLDHNDDRTRYLGASHAHCNDSAAGIASHRYDPPGGRG